MSGGRVVSASATWSMLERVAEYTSVIEALGMCSCPEAVLEEALGDDEVVGAVMRACTRILEKGPKGVVPS